MMPMVVAPSLCIAVAADGSSLELEACTNSSAAQQFELPDFDHGLSCIRIAGSRCGDSELSFTLPSARTRSVQKRFLSGL